jgi:hypothetical protein
MVKEKGLADLNKKDWPKFIRGMTFFGVFIAGIGLYATDWRAFWFGLVLTGTGVSGGFVLHYFFGIKIIDLRRDFKNKKY